MEADYPNEALDFYEKAIAKSPKCEDAYLQMALLYDEYLNDRQNAIIAYEKFLSITKSPAMRERVQNWLAEMRESTDALVTVEKKNTPEITDDKLQAELTQRENQFKLLRQQLIDRHESKLEVLQQEILDANEKVTTLENENNLLKSENANKEIAQLIDTVASNEQLIANLDAKLDESRQENKAANQSLKAMQSMFTNLQYRFNRKNKNVNFTGYLAESNALLSAENELLNAKLKSTELEKNELEKKLSSSVRPSLSDTAEIYSTEKFESLISATNKIAELEQKIIYYNQAKNNLVNELYKLRKITKTKDKQLAGLRGKLSEYEKLQTSYAKLKPLQEELEQERKLSANWKKLFYNRAVSLKKLQQQYDTVYRRYQYELNQNRKINNVLTSLQNDISSSKTTAGRRNSTRKKYKIRDKSSTEGTIKSSISGSSSKVTKSRYTTKKQRPKTYAVRRGDTLMNISRKLYGDDEKWELIFKANRDILNRPNQLKVGQILRIP
jgi:uncharacterized coiled-coil protein SlyX